MRIPLLLNNNPALSLNFLSGTLPSQVSFSRAGNATEFDSTGRLTYAPNNLLTFSNTFSNAAWAKQNTVVTNANAVPDPFGGTNASTLTSTVANGFIDPTASFGTQIGENYLVSCWVRRRTGTGNVLLFDVNAGTGHILAVSSSWQQFYWLAAATGTTGITGVQLASSGDAVDIYGCVASAVTHETTPRPQDQVATAGSAYYGPRFDYNPSTLALNGLLIEGQSTNLVLHSEDFSTTWTTGASSVTTNTTVAPDGNTTADTITDTAVASVHYVAQSIETASGSTTYTASCFFKAGTKNYAHIQLSNLSNADAHAVFDLSLVAAATGTTGSGFSSPSATITNVGGGWFRCVLTATASNGTSVNMAVGTAGGALASNYNYTGTGSGTVIAWGAQLEKNATSATSYIPTTNTAVTRAADVASEDVSALGLSGGGTLQADGLFNVLPTQNNRLATLSDGTAANRILVYTDGVSSMRGYVAVGNTQIFAGGNGSPVIQSGVVTRGNVSWGGSTFGYANGNALTPFAGAAQPTITTLYLGSDNGSGNFMNGWLRSVKIWRPALSQSRAQSASLNQ